MVDVKPIKGNKEKNGGVSWDRLFVMLLIMPLKMVIIAWLVFAPLSLEVDIRARICAKHILDQLQMIFMMN